MGNLSSLLSDSIEILVGKANDPSYIDIIDELQVINAKNYAKFNGYSTFDFLLMLSSLNLLNAAIKRKEFKGVVTYPEIKGNASRLINYFSKMSKNKYGVEFYLNMDENYAYFEIVGLQFGFHNIRVNDALLDFVDSGRNNVKPWKEIRLQKIAGSLFELVLSLKDEFDKD
jgi:hypothetical protein